MNSSVGRTYVPNKAKITEGKLTFDEKDGFLRALDEGFFYVQMPANFDISAAKKLALNFYKDKSPPPTDPENIYKGYNGGPNSFFKSPLFKNGYIDRENNQGESLYLLPDDVKPFPEAIVGAADSMMNISTIVLESVLEKLNIPKETWDEATGGCLNRDNFMFGFNHFRPEKAALGAVVHKDSGWVTVLYSEQPGLIACIGENRWSPIDPVQGYFTVNFGSLLDLLTKDCKPQPAHASLHKVERQFKHFEGQPDRFSIAMFLQPKADETKVYTYDPQTQQLIFINNYKDFFAELVKRYDNPEADESTFSSEALSTMSMARVR